MTFKRAVLESSRAVGGSIGLWCMGAAIVGGALEASGVADLGGSLWASPMLFFALVLAHEFGHILAIYASGGAVSSIDTRGALCISLSFRTRHLLADIACVLAGPATACVVGLTTAFALSPWPAIAFFTAATAVAHVAALAAPIGDGHEVRLLVRSAMTAR